MIIGILAILKAGGAYVPLDPSYASDRLVDILGDVVPAIVMADKVGRDALGETALSLSLVVDPSTLEQYSSTNPRLVHLTPRHLAYVIYTSGSTGKPKGVLIEHHGAVHLICDEIELFGIASRSRIVQFTSLSFDNSVSEIFSSLSSGASLYLLQDNVRLDKHRLWDFINEHSITYVSLTPTMLQGCQDMPPLSTLQTVISMGEAMPPTLLQALKVMAPNSSIFNAYGPTETTVGALIWKHSTDHCGDIVPIGRPYANQHVYLLDERGRPVPLGATGELFIGGVGVARGYLNRPDLTSERFLPDPFAGDPNARMYKTGDLGRYLPDGNMLYLGRNDSQVKIRGFRIELGEIEARLREHPLVVEAVVIALGQDNNKRLVAYVVAQSDAESVAERKCK
jgi:amino acid adenylation domain-containing protein